VTLLLRQSLTGLGSALETIITNDTIDSLTEDKTNDDSYVTRDWKQKAVNK